MHAFFKPFVLSLLCAVCGMQMHAGDVVVDASGNLVIGTDPQLGDTEVLRTAGVVRAGNVLSGQTPVEVTGTTTLTATAFGNWHLVSGTTGDYLITLPDAVVNQGKCIGFRVRDATAASKTYTVTPFNATQKIDGNANQALVANGNLVLMSDGTGWARIGGTSTGSGGSTGSTAALTDWQDGGPITITATTTNPTKGTTTRDKVWWRRVGDSAEIRFEYDQTGAGSVGAGDYLFHLPAGLSIDTTKCKTDTATSPYNGGVGSVSAAVPGTVAGSGQVIPYDGTRVRLVASRSGTSSYDRIGVTAYSLANTLMQYYARFTVPIAGWSGSQVVQQGSRYLWAQRYATTATRVTTTPTQLGQYRTRRLGADTAPTTVPSAADGFRMDSGSGIAAGRINRYDIFVGPNKVIQVRWHRSPGRRDPFNTTYYSAGAVSRGVRDGYDPTTGVLSLVCYTSDATDSVGYDILTDTHYATGYFDILVADDPVPVAIAPSVHVEASSDAGQAVTANTTDLQWEDEAYDSHGAWSGSVFTAPVIGVYLVTAAIGDTSAAATPSLWKNGALYSTGTYNSIANQVATLTTSLRLNAGDTIRIRSGNNFTRSTTWTNNWIRITRIGD